MQHITTFIKKYHPDLLLWSRFPGLISFTGIIAGIWLSSIAQYQVYNCMLDYSLCAGLITAVIITVALLIKQNSIRFILFIIAGALIYQIRLQCFCSQTSEINSFCAGHNNISTSGTVMSNPAPVQTGSFTFLLKTDSINIANKVLRINKTFICKGPLAPLYGSVITVRGKVSLPSKENTPFIFNDFNYLYSNNIFARITFDNLEVLRRTPTGLTRINGIARNYALEIISNLTNADYRSVLRAAFIGENRFLSKEIKEKFRQSGIYHLLAISGLHAAMLAAAAFALLFFVPVPKNIKRFAVIAILWIYQFFIGWYPSLLRATIMASMMIAAFLFEKKQYTLQSLGIAGTVILLLSPAALFSPGFQLSFAATAGIITLYPRLASFRTGFGPPFFQALTGYLYASFCISLCGFLFTAPILVYHFGTISLFGLLSNIAAVLIMTSAMWHFFISLLLQPVIPVIVLPLSKLLSLHFDLLFGIADLARLLPFSDFQLPIPDAKIMIAYILILSGTATIKKQYLPKFCLITIPVFILLVSAEQTIHHFRRDIRILQYIDTSSSWAAIRWPGGKVWVINYRLSAKKTNQNQVVKQWMRRYAGSCLERVFCTEHTHPPIKNYNDLRPFKPGEIMLIMDSLVLDCPGNRNFNTQSNKCVLYNRKSPIQMTIQYDSDTFLVAPPPIKTNTRSVLLKTLN